MVTIKEIRKTFREMLQEHEIKHEEMFTRKIDIRSDITTSSITT